jgi:N-acetylmuramoyl-L-alanine amidase
VIGTRLPHRIQLSPNVNERKGGKPVSILLLHYTGMKDSKTACDWLCSPESQVSSHYLIDEEGRIVHMVDEASRAWHAGVSSWRGDDDINSISIGIEIQNRGHNLGYHDFPETQTAQVIALSKDIIARYAVPARNVLAHSDVAPDRKIDPGEKFDWKVLHEQGVGHFVEADPISGGSFLQEGDEGDTVMALQAMLKLYGYGIDTIGVFDARTKLVVEAFQRHFRVSRVDGIADPSTVTTLHRLLKALPNA